MTRLGPLQRLCVYVTSLGLAFSGAGWLLAHFLLRSATERDMELPQPSEVWWLRLHGAAVVAFLVAFGSLLPGHVSNGWRRRLNVTTGALVVLLVVFLSASGYGLYYVASDVWRPWISAAHWMAGIAAVTLGAGHSLLGRRLSRQALGGPGGGP